MRSEMLTIDDPVIANIVEKLLSQKRDAVFSYRTDTRHEYDLLLEAARKGRYPELLAMTHKGLRLNKRHVHAPPRVSSAVA